jgi:hypothetical protein
MKRTALLVLAACTLDPQGVIDHAVLKVDLYGADGDNAQLSVTDSMAHTVEKKTPVRGDPMEMLFEQNTVATGTVLIDAELFDDGGTLIGCAVRSGTAGETSDPVLIAFSSPSNSEFDCGTCGNVCKADNAMAACVSGVCQYTCNSGYVPGDAGCQLPVLMMPDAGPMPDGGPTPDAGMDMDGGMDAGMPCVPSPEDTDVACSDMLDNNCDGRTDCADPGCQSIHRACTTSCNTPGTQTWDCSSHTWSTCAGDPNDEHDMTACGDGIDNDCDGKIDCADDGCTDIKVPCAGGLCVGGAKLWDCTTKLLGLICLPQIPLPEAPLFCGDGLDNNCDGKIDCADSTCTGKACGGGKTCCPDGSCKASCQ